jgi:predicted metalloprotease with PDZ domain
MCVPAFANEPLRAKAFPGVIELEVDASDTERHIFQVRETIPVAGGTALKLYYPKWLPANHAPRGRIDKIAGLVFTANGERLAWRRDTTDEFAVHVDVPVGATRLVIEFQFLSPTNSGQGRVVMTPEMLNLQWTSVSFYPDGFAARDILVRPRVRFPKGWRAATALRVLSTEHGVTQYNDVSYEDLIDSPILAGVHFTSIDLDPDGDVSVQLNIIADRHDYLAITSEQVEVHRELVRQADRLFGPRHFEHYDFLLALTDRMGGIGLEHQQSSENSLAINLFTDWEASVNGRDLLAHEYAHSWNGKFRRPVDLLTPDFHTPMGTSLLWMYEGQTQYWGRVLAARSGLSTHRQALDVLAWTAATYAHRVGRKWRPLQDTTFDPIVANRRPQASRSWSRSEDYYSEGLLVWLDADTLIRQLSQNRRSLDDFARAFFAINGNSRTPVSYTFEDIVDALKSVQPYDWTAFLRSRLDHTGDKAPLDGLTRGGYELIYTETPSAYMSAWEAAREQHDLTFSLGLRLKTDGSVLEVLWDSPAFAAGVSIGDKLIAVNGKAYSFDGLRHAIIVAKDGNSAIDLILQDGDQFRTLAIVYHDGLRYPQLVKTRREASLDQILAPLRR